MKIRQQLCLNGTYIYSDEPIFTSENRAFRYGDAVFESMFVSSKKAPLLSKHIARIQKAMNYWEMELPIGFSEERIAQEIVRLCNKNRLYQGARARLTIFRKNGGLYTPATNESSYLLEVSHCAVQQFTLNEKGWLLGVFQEDVKYYTPWSQFKTAQSGLSVKAGIFKKKAQYDEVLLLTPEKNIIEATAFNIFVIGENANTLYTPAIESGCVAGVMRSTIIAVAREMGYTVEEVGNFSQELLAKAEEVFLTNAVVGIRWVLGWENKRYFKTKTQKIVKMLNEKHFQNV